MLEKTGQILSEFTGNWELDNVASPFGIINQTILDTAPVVIAVWNENREPVIISEHAKQMFGIPDPMVLSERLYDFSPEFQPCGTPTPEKAEYYADMAYTEGYARFEWMHKAPDGGPMPVECIYRRFALDGKDMMVSYTIDLRDAKSAMSKIMEADERAAIMLDSTPLSCFLVREIVETGGARGFEAIDCNPAALELFGFSTKREALARFHAIFPGYVDNKSAAAEAVFKNVAIAAEVGSHSFEFTHCHLDGKPIPCEITLVRVNNKGETIFACYQDDLREIKAAMEKEREAFELSQTILDAAPFVINIWGDDYNILSANKQVVALYGVSEEQFIHEFFDILPERQPCGTNSKEKAKYYLDEAYRSGYVKFEWMHRAQSGRQVPVEITLVRATHRGKTLLLEFTTDLSNIKAAELFTKKLLDYSPIFMTFWDTDGNLHDCNRQLLEVFGLDSRDEFVDRFSEFSLPYQPCGTPSDEKVRELIKYTVEDGHHRSEWVFLLPDGEEMPVDSTWVNVTHQGRSMVLVYSHDLRPIKKAMEKERHAEIAEESSKAKSRFLARMSHEIRTPITAVLGISEIQLKKPGLSPTVEESFAKIYDSGTLLLSIVNDILDLSKIEAGEMSLICEEYEVASFISDAIHPLIVHVPDKDVELHLHVDESLPEFFVGDSLRIRQILNNILSNAFKYTQSGSIDIFFHCQTGQTGKRALGDTVEFTIIVSDTGVGMSKVQLETLYSEYTRFHESLMPSVVGTGLGMPIVYNLAKMMGASVDVESEKGVGTSVTVCIPQKVASLDMLGKEVADNLQRFEMSAQYAGRNLNFVSESDAMPYGRVLIVDDIDANLYVASGLLGFYDLNIDTCKSGYDAIEKIRRGNVYDIVFMDYMMPGIDGVETLHIIRKMGYTGIVVALTANAMIGQADKFIGYGFDAFLSKPIQTAQMHSVLLKYIRDKHPEIHAAKPAKSGAEHNDAQIDDYLLKSGLEKKVQADFVDTQESVFAEITQALASGDTKTAHRLAHNLKSFAGLLDETALMKIASDAEYSLGRGEMPADEILSTLENELRRTLEKIGKTESAPPPISGALDKAKATKLLDRLVPMLEICSGECLDLIEDLRMVPETDGLIKQIEDFDMNAALETVQKLRSAWENEP